MNDFTVISRTQQLLQFEFLIIILMQMGGVGGGYGKIPLKPKTYKTDMHNLCTISVVLSALQIIL